jgi:hypothetical protein
MKTLRSFKTSAVDSQMKRRRIPEGVLKHTAVKVSTLAPSRQCAGTPSCWNNTLCLKATSTTTTSPCRKLQKITMSLSSQPISYQIEAQDNDPHDTIPNADAEANFTSTFANSNTPSSANPANPANPASSVYIIQRCCHDHTQSGRSPWNIRALGV